ncbi:hypothetical protein GLOTRDRAFT_135691 [Gloeophyllum trabeum ATCC 11539]|uniref:Uncharacterized protein n=1 Tax=Gloeophyllum trabeum (strain ATCC 11539 / FP-39264 / Madison 617) TaxID=670483 RepID=S7QPA3_GLOTA|nr:uncharacterized protein GLOTRDRAFT_135691 [Gloeophyllum trabeum ATCC 11539]EPQ61152.1 hypothetical protein GLOTRDRAFT_135691 [Gloeophyllum trabeum ATCC 11539]
MPPRSRDASGRFSRAPAYMSGNPRQAGRAIWLENKASSSKEREDEEMASEASGTTGSGNESEDDEEMDSSGEEDPGSEMDEDEPTDDSHESDLTLVETDAEMASDESSESGSSDEEINSSQEWPRSEPRDIDESWPYHFEVNDKVWYGSISHYWALYYPGCRAKRECSPQHGNIKPDTPHIRRLLEAAGVDVPARLSLVYGKTPK